MSSIVKAKYVVYDDKYVKNVGRVESEPQVISTPREDLYEIYNQREIILKEANEEAMKIISAAKRNAQTEIAELKKRGYEEGFNAGMEIGKNKGYEEGFKAGKIQIADEIKRQNQAMVNEISYMIEEIEKDKEEIITRHEAGLTSLAISIAEKIIRQKIDANENVISKIIDNTISNYRNIEWIKIFISGEEDVKKIKADKELISNLSKISSDVKIEISKELEEGSVIIETPEGIVDAGITTQLNNLKEMVLSKNGI
ncbi:MAG: FliH/SctL family protein [Sedimentibacter sp.]|uniref:FliH/SctL family protein n=1 Tax=Sedimentibacter sp. TaxID=1960295 RepID=UPI00315931F9